MYAEEGLQITLSPVQLAAVLSDDSVSEGETTSNRLWGSGMVLLGALELVGAATLCRIRAKTIDVAVPMAFAGFAGVAGAARVGSIRAGRIKLIEHEVAGGHTIAKHVGKSKEELLQRLKTDPRSPPATSSFANLDIAEKAISQAIKANKLQIQQWNQTSAKNFLKIEYGASFNVGVYVKRGSTELLSTSKFRVILRRHELHGKTYYILTSFPIW